MPHWQRWALAFSTISLFRLQRGSVEDSLRYGAGRSGPPPRWSFVLEACRATPPNPPPHDLAIANWARKALSYAPSSLGGLNQAMTVAGQSSRVEQVFLNSAPPAIAAPAARQWRHHRDRSLRHSQWSRRNHRPFAKDAAHLPANHAPSLALAASARRNQSH